jgi:hypothetical protein
MKSLPSLTNKPEIRSSNSLIIDASIVIGNTDPHGHSKVKLILRLRLVVTVGEALAHLFFKDRRETKGEAWE